MVAYHRGKHYCLCFLCHCCVSQVSSLKHDEYLYQCYLFVLGSVILRLSDGHRRVIKPCFLTLSWVDWAFALLDWRNSYLIHTASGRIERVLDYHDQNVHDCLFFHFVQGLKPLESEHAEMRLHEVLNELREKCRRQRLLMYPYFKDYDRVGTAYAAVCCYLSFLWLIPLQMN